ncbi:MAG: exo-alpha-sialidase, partial [Clostridia bacterium]|nr:exo-alpha-sialidase [Clostridia bacterium]
APIKNVPFVQDFKTPCGEASVHSYRYGDIPNECKGVEFGRIDAHGETSYEEINFDFPEREVLVNYKANPNSKSPADVLEYIQPYIFKSPYMSSLHQLSDGTFVALATGQNPQVDDRYCSEVYLVASDDNGKTWKKRATVASDISDVPFGYGGSGGEVSLTVADDDTMFCVIRMDMSIHPDLDDTKCWGCYFCASFDKGMTWTKPKEIADSSVTPHIIFLKDGVLLVIYGRPGIHFKISTDNGETWSDSYSIIGKTLTEEKESIRSDFDSKYADSCSYSNTFVEKISDDSVIVCYNNLRYPDKNGVDTKAAFVRKIRIS